MPKLHLLQLERPRAKTEVPTFSTLLAAAKSIAEQMKGYMVVVDKSRLCLSGQPPRSPKRSLLTPNTNSTWFPTPSS